MCLLKCHPLQRESVPVHQPQSGDNSPKFTPSYDDEPLPQNVRRRKTAPSPHASKSAQSQLLPIAPASLTQKNIVINKLAVKGEKGNNCKTHIQYFQLFIQAHEDYFSGERDTKETNITEVKSLIGFCLWLH